MAKYPFIQEAKEWVKNEKIGVEEILNDVVYERARIRAVERVEEAMEHGIINNAGCINQTDCMMEIFSYPIARMIVVSIESDFLLRRYALAEAKKAYENLKNENIEIVEHVAKEFTIEIKNGMIHFSDYLKYAPTWDMKWKLINRLMDKGYIQLSYREITRLLQEAIRKKIQNELFYLFSPPDVKKIFNDFIIKMKNKLALKGDREFKGEASFKDFPPCIKNLISAVKSGINVPHVGRFTLVTFLNAIGMSVEEILKIFSSSPDFNEEKTRYQIEHITGRISGTMYSVPKCSTIRTWGLCEPDELCKKVNHPLFYYRIKRRKK